MATYSNHFIGGVDELRFYKGACTDEEIIAQFYADGGITEGIPGNTEGVAPEIALISVLDTNNREGVNSEIELLSASWV